MRSLRFHSLLCLTLIATHAAAAQDIEDAPTPTTLTELLPDGDIDAVDIEQLLLVTDFDASFEGGSTFGYQQWELSAEDGRLVSRYSGSNDEEEYTRGTTVFDRQGRLVEWEYEYRSEDEYASSTHALVEADQIVANTSINDSLASDKETLEIRTPLSDFEGAVQADWLPLVMAYHHRRGSERYACRMVSADAYEGAFFYDMSVEVQGEQAYELNGEEVRVYLHTAIFTYVVDGETTRWGSEMLVLDNGLIVEETLTDQASGEVIAVTRQATPQEIEEELGIELD